MTITEYARHRGCQLRAVQYAIEQGRITRDANGMLDSDRADRDWDKNTNHAKARYGAKPRRDPAWSKHRAAEAADASEAPEKMGNSLSYANARAAREIYEAKLKKIEWEEKLGSLVPKRSVEVSAFNRGRVLRDAMMNIPTRLAAQLAADTDPASVHEALENEIRLVFDEFSEGKLG